MSRTTSALTAAAGYVIVGTGTALLARAAHSPSAVKGWRLGVPACLVARLGSIVLDGGSRR